MPFPVQDLIKDHRSPVVVKLTDTAQTAVDLMMEHDFSQLPVVDRDSKPCGLVTSDSILRAHASLNLPLEKLHVRDAMTKKPRAFEASEDLFEMLEYVMDSDAVFVVDGEGRLTGIATSYDTTEYFRRRAEDLMLVEDIEMALREHIRCAYSGPNGSDGQALNAAVAEFTRDSGGQRGKFRGALKKYVAKTNGQVDDAAANEAFDTVFANNAKATKFEDLNLSDYIQMVTHRDRWKDHFEHIFTIEREALAFMLERVRKTRNALAHFHGEIDSTQRNHLRFCTEWLGRHPPVPPTAPSGPVGGLPPPVPQPLPTEPEPSADPVDRAQAEDVSPEDSRYTPLATYLQSQADDRVDLTFAQVEAIIGGPLPAYARKHRSWWSNDSVGHVQSQQWLDVGWRMLSVSVGEEKVSFYRPTERAQAYLSFFSSMVEDLENKAPGLFVGPRPFGLNWLNVRYVSQGGSRVGVLALTFALRSRFRAEFYIDTGDRDRNKAIFDGLLARKQDIESQIGEVGWERLDTKRASRIALYRPGSIDDEPEKLAALRAWGVESLSRLKAVIVPLLEEGRG